MEAGALSYGGQRLVDMGLALATGPRILLLDEPLAGLAAAERERIGALVKKMSSEVPVLLVEHDIDRVFRLADHVTVMNEGRVLVDGSVEDARSSRRVQDVYIGSGQAHVVAWRQCGHAQVRFDPHRRLKQELVDLLAANRRYGRYRRLLGPGPCVAIGHRGRQPLTEPAVRPPARFRWMSRKKATTGSPVSVAAAISGPHWGPWLVVKEASQTVSVCLLLVLSST